MGKRAKRTRGKVELAIAAQRKLYRLYGCSAHVGMKGGKMLVYWALIRCCPEFSGRYYEDAFFAFVNDLPPTSCRMSERIHPPAGLFVPGPIEANIPPSSPPQPPAKKATSFFGDPFLDSYEWRKTRMIALKRDGARCLCCGATAADGVKIHVDHIKPRKTHPELALDPNNLQVLCEVCNHGKGNWDQTDWHSQEKVLQ